MPKRKAKPVRLALPVTTPFHLPFSVQSFTMGTTWNQQVFSVYVPSNIFMQLTSIKIICGCGPGIRPTTGGKLDFLRGDKSFLHVAGPALKTNTTLYFCWCDINTIPGRDTYSKAYAYQIPSNIYLYPEDQIYFDFPSFLPGDVFGPVTIHGKTWEVH